MMKLGTFLRLTLSEDGNPSAKRVALFILLFLFIFEALYNLFTGKVPDQTLQSQLYYLLTTAYGLVFGSNIVSAIKDIKVIQSNNNTKVNAPSPTQPPAPVIIPKSSDVIITK